MRTQRELILSQPTCVNIGLLHLVTCARELPHTHLRLSTKISKEDISILSSGLELMELHITKHLYVHHIFISFQGSLQNIGIKLICEEKILKKDGKLFHQYNIEKRFTKNEYQIILPTGQNRSSNSNSTNIDLVNFEFYSHKCSRKVNKPNLNKKKKS